MSKTLDGLASLFRNRPTDLKELKGKGVKIVGFNGSYIPEEIIYAAGAVPQLTCRGGDYEAVRASLPYIIHFVSPYIRAQFGSYILDNDPFYPLLDIIVAQCSDAHMSRLADLFEFYTKIPVVKIGVPTDWTKRICPPYYLRKLKMMKEKVEKLTDVVVTDERLREYVAKFNAMRTLLEEISMLRKDPSPPISGCDFIKLNHYSFYSDIDTFTQGLEQFFEELKGEGRRPEDAPRILLAGHVVAVGDYIVPSLIEKTGAAIVAEQLDEGIRPYWWRVKTDGDLMENLSNRYYKERLPSSVQQPSWEIRLQSLQKLIKDFKVDGLVWYQLQYDEIHDMESYVVGMKMREIEVPMLKLESSYDTSGAMGTLLTRIETFIETIKENIKR